MTVTALGNGVHQIAVALPFATPPQVNCYVIEGSNGLTLIDAGVDDHTGRSALEAAIRLIGGHIESLSTIVGTHLHVDHIAGAGHLRRLTDAAVVMHSSTAAHLDDYNDWDIGRRFVADLAERNGATVDEVAELRQAWPRPEWAAIASAPDRVVDDLDTIDLGGGRHLEVLHTPGHHPTHICLRDSLTGRLFSGDHVLGRITPFVPYAEDRDRLGNYLESLERIESLDAGLTYPAHGNLIDHGQARTRQIMLHHARRIGAMLEQTRNGSTTAWEIMRLTFRPDMDAFMVFLAFQETMAHLEHMTRIGRVQRTLIDGVWRYHQ